jgi:hypothetical protein
MRDVPLSASRPTRFLSRELAVLAPSAPTLGASPTADSDAAVLGTSIRAPTALTDTIVSDEAISTTDRPATSRAPALVLCRGPGMRSGNSR